MSEYRTEFDGKVVTYQKDVAAWTLACETHGRRLCMHLQAKEKLLADARSEIAALRTELAELQENYHLLNEAVARVLRKPKEDKR
jgi:septal ring factor EnvC (AmiA/AmiB activator)